MTLKKFLVRKATSIARRMPLARRAAGLNGFTLKDEQIGVLYLMAGLTLRRDGAPVSFSAVIASLDEAAINGIIIRETVWLRRTGHVIGANPDYIVTELGWAALDQHLITTEREACGEPSPDDPPVPTAKETPPDVLIVLGDWQITAEARRLTKAAFLKARGQIDPHSFSRRIADP